MKSIFISALLAFQIQASAEIYDTFIFFNELELLKVRFEELYEEVDHFVLVEATETFSGKHKPLYFSENRDLFKSYEDKIIHVIVNESLTSSSDLDGDRWKREEIQRNAILNGLKTCNKEDIILISDLDEIPSKNAIREIKEFYKTPKKRNRITDICSLKMRYLFFYLNWASSLIWDGGSKAALYHQVEKHSPWDIKTLHMRNSHLHKIENAGWHFHSMGGAERRAEKLEAIYLYDTTSFIDPTTIKSISPECAKIQTDYSKENWPSPAEISKNQELFVEWTQAIVGGFLVEIDETYPSYIRNNLDYFKSLGWLK